MQRLPFRTLLSYVTPHRRVLLLAVVLMAGESALALVHPWLAGVVSRSLLDGDGLQLDIQSVLGLWGLLLVAQSGLSFANRYLLGSTGETMLAGLRNRLYDHLQSLPVGYFHERRRGDVLALLGNDAASISQFVTSTLVSVLPLAVTFVGALIMLFRIDPLLAGLAGTLIPVFFLATKLVGRRLRPLSTEWVNRHAEMFSTLEENIGMLPAIKSFTREAHESGRFRSRNTALMITAKRRLLVQSVLGPAVHLMAGLGLLLLLFVAAFQLEVGRLSAPELISALLYSMLLTRPVSGLAGVYGSIQTARGAAQRLLEVFSVNPEPDDRGAPPMRRAEGHIRFEGVSFGYPGRDPALTDLDLEIRAGETVAITGPNGAGKSTLVHLLMRFADPGEGRILIDGTEIRAVSISSLRRQIGVVAQRVLLLNASVRDNIAYGRPDADDAMIEAAAKAAMAHGFICDLPAGYDTLIGDQGIRLSGGQGQRIALARALIKDPPILVLDEATAMFDPEGEQDFIEACRPLLERRTVLLITHRPAALALADRILRMEKPGVREKPGVSA
jgi:ABC-type multidrug transport system fused ATPase/permease subunit